MDMNEFGCLYGNFFDFSGLLAGDAGMNLGLATSFCEMSESVVRY